MELRVIHHHPGRLRLRSGAFRSGDVHDVREALRHFDAVGEVQHDPFTGSVLVTYTPGSVDPEQLVDAVADAARLERVSDETHASGDDLAEAVRRVFGKASSLANEATGGRADLRQLVPAALFAGAIVSFVKRPRLPPWENLLVWSAQFFWQLNKPA